MEVYQEKNWVLSGFFFEYSKIAIFLNEKTTNFKFKYFFTTIKHYH